MSTQVAKPHQVTVDNCVVDLKNRYIAAALALLFPAAGHFYQGRKNKAYLFAACILGLFLMGMFIGKGRVVYCSFSADDFRIQYPAQVLVGLPAAPSLLQAFIGKQPPQRNLLKGFMAPPVDRAMLSKWHLESSAGFELGTLYTAVAGLLNLLVIMDAFAGPMPMPQSNQRRNKQPSPS